jgi:cupin fold WbuC family metalloprotein
MFDKIYSNVEPGKLLHIVCRPGKLEDVRSDIVGEQEYLQLAILNFSKGKTFRPHKHIYKPVPKSAIAQESWVVMSGRVEAIFYDIDDTIVERRILETGDLSITLFGGHNYIILEDNTLVLEYKTGPYYGQANDKEFIDE